MDFDFDLFVIGGGSGGVRAARVAAALGVRVGLAEEYRMGGTCVIRGCVPKKLMVYASQFGDTVETATAYGWDVSGSVFNWTAFQGKMAAEIDRLEGIYRNLLGNSGVSSFDARATLEGPNTIALSTGERFSAKKILIATGGRPVKPKIPGADLGITSNEIFQLESLPKSILIVGGGYIASEFAGILNGMGVDVTQIYRGPQILRGFDDDARHEIASQMEARGVDLRVHTDISAIEQAETGLRVTGTNGLEGVYDQVMFATGRMPNTEGLGLEAAGVVVGVGGEVVVDEFSATAQASIYAVGDVTGRAALTPVAIRDGMAFVETVFKDNPTPVDHELIPTAVFTQPEFGTVGMTEAEAEKAGPIAVYMTRFKPMNHAFAGWEHRVLMKLIVARDSRRVLGVHIVGDNAGEMIQMAGIAVKMGATKEDFDRTVAVHPTAAEELVTLKEPSRTT